MAQMQDRPLYPNNSKSDPYLGTREQFRAKNKAFVRLKKSQGVDIDEEEYLKGQDEFYTFKFKQRKANSTEVPVGMRSNPKREGRRKSNFRSTLSMYGITPKI